MKPKSEDRPKIAVVDDEPDFLLLVESWLKPVYDVTSFSHCDGLVEKMRALAPDLVLLDIHMPVMGGIEAVQQVRAGNAGRRDIPVIALTADAMPGVDERLIASGFDHVAPKPIDPSALIWAIADLAVRGSNRQRDVEALASA